jgi:hypothetical protein
VNVGGFRLDIQSAGENVFSWSLDDVPLQLRISQDGVPVLEIALHRPESSGDDFTLPLPDGADIADEFIVSSTKSVPVDKTLPFIRNDDFTLPKSSNPSEDTWNFQSELDEELGGLGSLDSLGDLDDLDEPPTEEREVFLTSSLFVSLNQAIEERRSLISPLGEVSSHSMVIWKFQHFRWNQLGALEKGNQLEAFGMVVRHHRNGELSLSGDTSIDATVIFPDGSEKDALFHVDEKIPPGSSILIRDGVGAICVRPPEED